MLSPISSEHLSYLKMSQMYSPRIIYLGPPGSPTRLVKGEWTLWKNNICNYSALAGARTRSDRPPTAPEQNIRKSSETASPIKNLQFPDSWDMRNSRWGNLFFNKFMSQHDQNRPTNESPKQQCFFYFSKNSTCLVTIRSKATTGSISPVMSRQ